MILLWPYTVLPGLGGVTLGLDKGALLAAVFSFDIRPRLVSDVRLVEAQASLSTIVLDVPGAVVLLGHATDLHRLLSAVVLGGDDDNGSDWCFLVLEVEMSIDGQDLAGRVVAEDVNVSQSRQAAEDSFLEDVLRIAKTAVNGWLSRSVRLWL